MPAPILAAYDPFRDDRAPVELALAATGMSGAPVTAVSVVPARPIAGDVGEARTPDDATIAGQALDRLRAELPVETRLAYDFSVPRALHTAAEQLGAGLLVVGSTARGPLGRVLPGSTAERLLHGASCPVALAPSGYRRSALGTIAVGFVDTPEGQAALGAAHALAARAGARLRAIAVLGADAGLETGRHSPWHGLEGRDRQAAEQALERALAALPPGVAVESEIHVDDPADVLVRISEHVDALVCGSRGYGPLRSVLLGGVSRRVVDGAHCPVLVLSRGVERPLEDLLPAEAETGAP
jgi:nucleotide-binding universal stress UspA family protein